MIVIMNKNKILKGVKIGIITVVSLIVIAVVLHLTMNYLVPFIGNLHNSGGVY